MQPAGKPRRQFPHPDAAPYIAWGIIGALCFVLIVTAIVVGRREVRESNAIQADLEAHGIVTPATVVGHDDPGFRYQHFEVEYAFEGVAHTGTVYTRANTLGNEPRIWVDPDDPTVIGVPYGAHGAAVTVTPYLTIFVLAAMLVTLVCTTVFALKASKPRRARRKRSTASGGLPQVFEAKVVARREGEPAKATHRERRGELVVSEQGLRYRSLAWRIDPIEIPWTDVVRIHLGRREGLSGGGEIEAAGWAELSIVPTARLRYRSALRHAGFVLHYSPWQDDLVEVTQRGGQPSWGTVDSPPSGTGDDQAGSDRGR